MHDILVWIDILPIAIGVILCRYFTYRMFHYSPLARITNQPTGLTDDFDSLYVMDFNFVKVR